MQCASRKNNGHPSTSGARLGAAGGLRRSGGHIFGFLLAGCLLLAGCAPSAAPPKPAPTRAAIQTATAVPTGTAHTPSRSPEAPPSPTVQPSPTLPATITPPAAVFCSPLEGILVSELSSPDLLKTRFERPRPGWDEGHHGVDFAYWSRGERSTMLGHPVQAALAGRVAAVLPERMPYGNAVIIETPLQALPPGWLESLPALSATPAPTVQAPSLQCPPSDLAAGPVSLYLLYAHLDQPSSLQPGLPVACGETVGAVGTTGKSVNFHLHLEARAGPAGISFPSMAHYQNDATEAERSAYCAWRVSGLFQLLDPMDLLKLAAK